MTRKSYHIVFLSGLLALIAGIVCKNSEPTAPAPHQVIYPAGVAEFAFSSNGDVFALTSSGIFRSTDNGNDWTKRKSAGVAPCCQLLIDQSRRLYGIAYTGSSYVLQFVLLRSVDDASSWQTITPTGALGGRLWISSQGLHLDPFRSSDGGTSWTRSSGFVPPFLGVGDSGKIYRAYADTLYKSFDDGTTWTTLHVGLPGVEGRQIVSDSGTLLLSVDCNYGLPSVWRSTNDGNNWSQVLVDELAGDCIALAIAPNGHPFASTTLRVYRSSNRGVTWMQTNNGLPDTAVIAFGFGIAPNGNLFKGTNAGVYRSSDDGDHWIEASTGLADTAWVP